MSSSSKGRHPLKKVANFRALPELAKPPPSPQFGQLGPLFSGRQNDVLRVCQEKSTNDDNDNCNDSYDSNDGNFHDHVEKMTKKHRNIVGFQQKCTNFRDFNLVKKGPKNLGIGKPPPPHFRAMPES